MHYKNKLYGLNYHGQFGHLRGCGCHVIVYTSDVSNNYNKKSSKQSNYAK